MLSTEEQQRYNRQIILEGIGVEGQQRIKETSILIVGVGGLGSVASLYCVAAGFGRVGLMDKDTVSLSNLQRQILYRENEVGQSKTQKAFDTLSSLNSNVKIEIYEDFISKDNADKIVSNYDIVIDATDNFSSRYIINDSSRRCGKPMIYGSIMGFTGQVSVFNFVSQKNGESNVSSSYRDLYPQSNELQEKKNATLGVMGVLPSITASLQVNEAIKLATANIQDALINKLLVFDLRTNVFTTLKLK